MGRNRIMRPQPPAAAARAGRARASRVMSTTATATAATRVRAARGRVSRAREAPATRSAGRLSRCSWGSGPWDRGWWDRGAPARAAGHERRGGAASGPLPTATPHGLPRPRHGHAARHRRRCHPPRPHRPRLPAGSRLDGGPARRVPRNAAGGITAELYLRAGGFPRSRIQDLHEDRALVNAVRPLTDRYAYRPEVVVRASSRRVRAWGLRRTLGWYADHRYRPDHVGIRRASVRAGQRIAVTGAAGFVGGAVVAAARERGDTVVALTRRVWDITTGPHPDAPLSRRPVRRCGGARRRCCHRPGRPPGRLTGEPARHPTRRHLVPGGAAGARVECERLRPVRPTVFAPESAAPVDRYLNAYGASKAAAERLLAGRSDTVVLRPHAVYGPGDPILLSAAACRHPGSHAPATGRRQVTAHAHRPRHPRRRRPARVRAGRAAGGVQRRRRAPGRARGRHPRPARNLDVRIRYVPLVLTPSAPGHAVRGTPPGPRTHTRPHRGPYAPRSGPARHLAGRRGRLVAVRNGERTPRSASGVCVGRPSWNVGSW